MAAAAAAGKSSASPFAAMLRRSKFASYDPQIAQVYTAHGGDAHRGNWGFKRPLTLHRRDACVVVKSVDSREQQTEFRRADYDATFVRVWEDFGVEVKAREDWDFRTGSGRIGVGLDSDFALGTKDSKTLEKEWLEEAEEKVAEGNSQASGKASEEVVRKVREAASVPNIMAMSESQFQRYLEELRAERPKFKAYLEAHKEEQKKQEKVAAKKGLTLEFLSERARDLHHSPQSKAMEQRPHPNAGLTYAKASPLTNYFLTKPQPARIIGAKLGNGVGHPVSIGGMLSYGLSASAAPVLSSVPVRVSSARLFAAPRPVGDELSSLRAVKIETTLKEQAQTDSLRANLHRPGTRAYIERQQLVPAYNEKMRSRNKRSMVRLPQKPKPKPQAISKSLVSDLRGMITQP
ncbi:hypothetical protein EWM64_g7536 [Hericium alpestre]|uniref:Uncharacterized protein n=1 Tax=Hericium alpestre TaxID=135208 RepID=A0A4Y9ZNM8_9AGAM|nr:hypothetical protein EWM64_g7536 [Hericium alpestre]